MRQSTLDMDDLRKRRSLDASLVNTPEKTQLLDLVDRQMASRLLTDKDPRAQTLARQFVAESSFLKKLIGEYAKRWTRKAKPVLFIKDHGSFVRDSSEIIELVLNRIQRETEHLYPLWRAYLNAG